MTLLTTPGSRLSHLPAWAVLSRLASTPSAAQSWIWGPFTCAAVGGCPETTRDLSTVMAVSPPPPATAKSFHVSPLASSSFLSSATDFASPPDVHQCRTSTSPPAYKGADEARPTAPSAVATSNRFMSLSPEVIDFEYRLAPLQRGLEPHYTRAVLISQCSARHLRLE